MLQAEPRAHDDVHDNATPATANAAPDPVTECVASSPAGTCAEPAPVTEYASSSPAAASAAPTPVSEHVAPTPAAFATRAEATFEISGADGGGDADLPAEQHGWGDAELPSEQLDGWNGAQVLVQPVVEAVVPESTDVTEGRGDADMPESMMEMSGTDERGHCGDLAS